jgi:multiple sugar transport system substrate-binding protein
MEESDKSDYKTFQARFDILVDTIRSEIRSGVYREGDFLPSEKAYAKEYRISNKTVRQGLEVLVAEGLIEKIARVGNKVTWSKREETAVLRFGCHSSLFSEALIHTLIAEFHKQHPEIRVEVFQFTSGFYNYERLHAMISEKSLDVFTMNYNTLDDFRLYGAMDELETLEPNKEIYPFLTETAMVNGQLKVQPFVFSPLILCYNKDHFREKGLMEPDSSWRWSVLSEHASQLAVENERLGFYFHFPSTNRWPVFLLQSGIDFKRDASGKIVVNPQQLAESLQACRELIYLQNHFPLFLSERDGDAEELFFSEKVSMIMTSYFALNHHERKTNFEYDVAPLPYLNNPKTMLLLIGLSLNPKSEHKETAKLFMDFLVSPRAQMMLRQRSLSIPSLKPAAEWSGKETMYRPSRFSMYRDIIPTFQPYTDLNMTAAELNRFYREAKLYWSGIETEEVAVMRLEQVLNGREAQTSGNK